MNEGERNDKAAADADGSRLHQPFERIDRLLKSVANGSNWVALIAVLAMFAVITLDILSSKLLNRPITGSVDIASLLATMVAAFAVSQTILARRHIEVEFIVGRLPRRARRVFNVFASALSFLFFVLVVWRSLVYAHELQRLGEASLTQHIPIAPFVYGIAVACIPAVVIYAVQLCRDIKEDR